MTLLKQQAKAEWVNLLVWCLIIGAAMFGYVYLFQSVATNGALASIQDLIKDLPAGFQALFGDQLSLLNIQGWMIAIVYGVWLLAPITIYTALSVTGMITREMDKRTIEFLLALPVTRAQVLLSRWTGMLVALAALFTAHLLGATIGVVYIGERATFGRYLLADVNAWLMMLAIGTVLLLISIFVDDYGRGVGVTLGVGLGEFLLYMSTDSATGVVKSIRNMLPNAFFDPAPILKTGAVPWGHLSVLAAITAVALGLALYFFDRKQIAL